MKFTSSAHCKVTDFRYKHTLILSKWLQPFICFYEVGGTCSCDLCPNPGGGDKLVYYQTLQTQKHWGDLFGFFGRVASSLTWPQTYLTAVDHCKCRTDFTLAKIFSPAGGDQENGQKQDHISLHAARITSQLRLKALNLPVYQVSEPHPPTSTLQNPQFTSRVFVFHDEALRLSDDWSEAITVTQSKYRRQQQEPKRDFWLKVRAGLICDHTYGAS